MFGQADILTYLRAEAISILGVELAKQKPGKFEGLFHTFEDPRERIQFGQIHRAGSMKAFGQGTQRPRTQPFVGGVTTLTADQFGEEVAWLVTTMEEARARGLDLKQLIEGAGGWVSSYGTGEDKLACNVLKNGGSTNGFDGVPLFSASHPTRSKFGDGATMSNQNAAGATASIDASSVRLGHQAFAETMAVAENGEEISNEPTHILVGKVEHFHLMKAVLVSEKLAGVALNDVNTLRDLGLDLQHWPRLKTGSTEYWYMAAANNGLEFQRKERLNIDVWYDPSDRTTHVGPAYQSVAGYRDFRAAYRQAIAA